MWILALRALVFADAIDAVLAGGIYDALINEADAGKMRCFPGVIFDQRRRNDGKRPLIPFGKGDCTKPQSDVDRGHHHHRRSALVLRTEAQGRGTTAACDVADGPARACAVRCRRPLAAGSAGRLNALSPL